MHVRALGALPTSSSNTDSKRVCHHAATLIEKNHFTVPSVDGSLRVLSKVLTIAAKGGWQWLWPSAVFLGKKPGMTPI